MEQLAKGLGTVPRALSLLASTPRLRRLAIGPAIFSIVALLLLFGVSLVYGPRLLDLLWPMPTVEGWLGWLAAAGHWLAAALVTLLLIVVSGAVFFFGSVLFAEPFIDPLSEGTERELGHEPAKDGFSVKGFAVGLAWLLGDIALDLSLFVLAQLVVWSLVLVPGIGTLLHVTLGWLVNAWFAGLEMVNGPLIRRRYRGIARWRELRGKRLWVIGLGSGILIILMIPLAGLITLPIAVVAGAMAVVDMERAGVLAARGAEAAAPPA